MDRKRCTWCGSGMVTARADARFCSTRCRVYWHRAARRLPEHLTGRARWVRHTRDKRPVTVTGSAASSTDPSTWASFDAARRSVVGVGFGFVLNGDGITCIDIDHCVTADGIDPRALEFIATAAPFYVEISPSGDGLHAWTMTAPPSERRRWTLDNGLPVEWYTDQRYMTVTGNRVSVA